MEKEHDSTVVSLEVPQEGRKRSFSDSESPRRETEIGNSVKGRKRGKSFGPLELPSFTSPKLSTSNSKTTKKGKKEKEKCRSPEKKEKIPIIHVHNELEQPLCVAIYYQPRITWGDAKRVTEIVEIQSGQSERIPKPPIQTDRRRKLVMTLNSNELASKLSEEALERLEVTGIDFDEEVFVEYRSTPEDSAFFKAYSPQQHIQRKKRNRLAKPKLEKERSSSPLRRSLRKSMTSSMNNLVIKDKTLLPSGGVEKVLIEDLTRELVTRRDALCPQELNFLQKRFPITHKAIERFLEMEEGSLDPKLVPRIAFTGSGGGARAMLCTIGVLEGLTDIGVEDCLTYVGGLSGSTWCFSVWEALGLSTYELATNVRYKFENGHMILPTTPVVPELKSILTSKLIFEHSKVSSITDVYAAQLSVHLFRDTNPPTTKFTLTDLIRTANLDEGLYPLPIFVSAIKEPTAEYEWFEFTPYSIGCAEYDCFIPTSLFGSKFVNSKLKHPNEEPHEICLAYLLATFGTAYCAPWRRVASEFFEKMEVQPVSLLSDLADYRERFIELLLRVKLGDNHAIEPPLFRNFMYGIARSPLRKFKYFPLVDAGIDFNLPFPPLLEPLREVDIIISSNSSRTPEIAENYSLHCMENYAKRKHLKFPSIDYEEEEKETLIYEKPWSMFCDDSDEECPIVIYLPLSKNPEFSEEFDPQENARVGGYCGTFNFDIKPFQFDEITSLTRFNTNLIKDALRTAILKKIEQRKAKVE